MRWTSPPAFGVREACFRFGNVASPLSVLKSASKPEQSKTLRAVWGRQYFRQVLESAAVLSRFSCHHSVRSNLVCSNSEL
jgi:hypothetical protein